MSTAALASGSVPASRRLRSAVGWLAVLAIVAVWAVELRPQFLGGPTSLVLVSGTSMEPRLHTGDVVLMHRRASYRVGDVVAYRIPKGQVGEGGVVIHRIRGGSAAAGFVMRGDNRTSDDRWRPTPDDIMGRRSADLPTGSRIFRTASSPIGLAALAAAFAFCLVAFGGGSAQRRPSPPPSRS